MSKINPRLLDELKKWRVELNEEDLIELAASNLDLLEPQKKVKSITAITRDELIVYTDGELIHRVDLKDIEDFHVVKGIGCVFVEYQRKADGEHVLFARGDSRYQAVMGGFVKRLNYFLRYGNADFSRFLGGNGERICPKCGKPYPKGSFTCPRCVSKKKVLKRLLSLAKTEWKPVVASSILFFFSTVIGVLIPYINRVMVDDYIQNESENVFLYGFLGVILALFLANVLRRLIMVARRYFLVIAGNGLVKRLRDMVFRKIQELSIAKISKRTSGDTHFHIGS